MNEQIMNDRDHLKAVCVKAVPAVIVFLLFIAALVCFLDIMFL